MGYFQAAGEAMEHLDKVDFQLAFDPDNPVDGVSGHFSLVCDSGRALSGRLETISGMEIDITHTFSPPRRTEYRRSLVRCHIEGEAPQIGWLECNRKPDANH